VQDKIAWLHTGREVNTLYELLYQAPHDLDQAIAITATQTINHSEVFVRAIRSHANDYQPWQLPRYQPPYWFEHHDHKNT
jgi:hypothetical protein